MATGLPKYTASDGADEDELGDTPPPPANPTESAETEDEKDDNQQIAAALSHQNSSGSSHGPPPPPPPASKINSINISQSVGTANINIKRINTPPASRIGGSVGGLPKVNTTDFQQRMEKASLNASNSEDKILASTNPLAAKQLAPNRNTGMHGIHGPSSSGSNLTGLISPISPLDEIKDEALESVEFTALLRQVDVGLEMTELLKEVIRKYSKHQNQDATKLQEIYGKMKNVYTEMDGMAEFSDVCNLAHKLILETVQQQKVLAEFLGNELVPRLEQHLKEKQSAVQILKKENQQAELRLQTSITAMNKAEHNFKNAAKKARAAADPAPRKKTGNAGKNDPKSVFTTFKKKIKNNKGTDMTEEEELYVKADQLSQNYEASVMTANHAQEKHSQICRHFKYRLRAIEESRMSYCTQQITQMMQKHKDMFENNEIKSLRNEVVEKAEKLDSTTNFDTWVSKATQGFQGKAKPVEKFLAKSYDYENAFYSLEDAMKVTRKLFEQHKKNPQLVKIPKNNQEENVPLIMSVLCEKVKECNGFKEEGIFRVNAAKSELDNLQRRIFNHNYEINSNNAHLSAHMLKEWLRHLKDSLVPGGYYDVCLDMAKKGNIDSNRLDVFISQLPEVNRDSIRYLVAFIKELLKPENTKLSKMDLKNVAIVFAPTVLRCPSNDLQLMLSNTEHEQAFFMQLVQKLNT